MLRADAIFTFRLAALIRLQTNAEFLSQLRFAQTFGVLRRLSAGVSRDGSLQPELKDTVRRPFHYARQHSTSGGVIGTLHGNDAVQRDAATTNTRQQM